jgi:pSer/pThr/pTyr-binding forkhead associated (FHA) protein
MSADLVETSDTSPTGRDPALSPPHNPRRRGLGRLHSCTHSLSGPQPTTAPSSYTFLPERPGLVARASSHPQHSVPTIEASLRAHPDPLLFEIAGGPNSSEENTPSASSDSTGAQEPSNTTRSIISSVMARYRAGSEGHGAQTTSAVSETDHAAPNLTGYPQDQMPTIRLIPHQDPRSNRPSLLFPPTSRTLPHEDCVIRVGRYSERDTNPNPPPNLPSSAPVGFKSKVVSRRHCEFWCSNGQWYIKDVKSSSGTFLNHIRLSQPSVESKPFPVNDGDVVQLGIDFRGGEEMIFRCVKIRVECNRAWQKSLNNFK